MPYKRSYAKKRTYSRRKYSARKPSLAREVRLIKRTIKPELKYLYPNGLGAAGTLNTVPFYGNLNLVPSGTGVGERVGLQILNKSVHVNCLINFDPACTEAFARCRVLLVWMKQPDGYDLDSPQLWDNGTSGTELFTSWQDRKTFKVLYDKTFTLTPTFHPAQRLTIRKKIEKVTEFDYDGYISTGSLWVVGLSDIATGNNPPIVAAINDDNRLFYTDC